MSEKVELVAKFKDDISGPAKTAGGNIQNFGKMAAGAGALVIGLSITVLALAKEMGELAAEIRDIAADLGITTDVVQGINYAFEQTGGSVGTFEKAMKGVTAFMRTAERGGAAQIAVLEDLGITYADLAAMNAAEQFYFLTDAIGSMEDPTKQATTGATLFGGAYQQIIGTINQAEGSIRDMSEAYQESDMLIPAEDIARLGEFADKWTDLEKKIQSLLAETIIPLLPLIEDMSEQFLDVAGDKLPLLIEAVEDAIPILMGMVDAAAATVEVFSALLSLGDTSGLQNMKDEMQALADTLEYQLAEGQITATEAAQQLTERLQVLTRSGDLNAEQTIELTTETLRLRNAFVNAYLGLDLLLTRTGDIEGALGTLSSGFANAGSKIVNMLVDMDALGAAIDALGEITPPGVISEDDVTKSEQRSAFLKQLALKNLAEFNEAEAEAFADRVAQEISSAAIARARRQEIKGERLATEAEIAAARIRQEQRIASIGLAGARELGQILINKGMDWEIQMLKAIAKMTLQMAAIAIGGPFGAIFSFVGGLFQGGGRVQHAQGGAHVVGSGSGLFGDRHPYLLEKDEVVIPREQVLMGNVGGSVSNIYITIPYQPTISTASPGEMVVLGNVVVEALEQAGVTVE